MMSKVIVGIMLWGALLIGASAVARADSAETGIRTFAVEGVVQKVDAVSGTITIRHEAITNYMAAMTMPFKAGGGGIPGGIQPGQQVRFELHVTANESWVDQIRPTGQIVPLPQAMAAAQPPSPLHSPLLDAPFTNELGQRVTLADFHGQALAITFFYTRCPLPDYCPRLSRNFQEASGRLAGRSGLPANWHFLSVTFDPDFDTPERLRSYGQAYAYDPAHWSFLSGSPEIIAGLARSAGVQYTPGGGTIDHNFRTLIVDTAGHLQMVFPTGGNLSDQIAAEMVKALAATNAVAISTPQNRL